MNGPIHFCTGYLAGRALGHRAHRFEPLYVAVAAYSPDFDLLLRKVSPVFAHGIWTHTLAGMAAMGLALSAGTYAVLAACYRGSPVPFWKLFALALLGGATHLILDAFTYYESAADAAHHRYFWPVWNFPWHINTVFPGASYRLRVAVEVVYSVGVAAVILLWQWGWRRENPLRALDPRGWFRDTPPGPDPAP